MLEVIWKQFHFLPLVHFLYLQESFGIFVVVVVAATLLLTAPAALLLLFTLFNSTAFSLHLICILTPLPTPPPSTLTLPLWKAALPLGAPARTITHKECTLKRICSPKKVGICKATDRFKCQLSWCTVGTLSYKVVSRSHLRETNTRSFYTFRGLNFAWTRGCDESRSQSFIRLASSPRRERDTTDWFLYK